MSAPGPKPAPRPSSVPATSATTHTPSAPHHAEPEYENAKGCLIMLVLGLSVPVILAVGYYLFGEHH